MSAFNYFIQNGNYPMLESNYPYTSGATGSGYTGCFYSAAKTTNVIV